MSARLERLWYAGEEESLSHRLAMSPLCLASGLYGAAVGIRNALYDRGMLKIVSVPEARVVSIGNLSVGGTGKTPTVIYLANLLAKNGHRPAVLTRGYGRQTHSPVLLNHPFVHSADEAGDEPLLIARSCPEVPVLVDSDRTASARRAVDELNASMLVLDDGMQHRKLARDLDIVVVDARVGHGNGRLLPRGPLRESIRGMSRANLIWLIGESKNEGLALPARVPVVRASYRPKDLLPHAGGLGESPRAWVGRDVVALAAIARPWRFRETLEALGMGVHRTFFMGDHHRFSRLELDRVRAFAEGASLPILTTAKDAVRLPAGYPAWVLRMEMEVTSGADDLMERLVLAKAR